jgi:hypothetical protein
MCHNLQATIKELEKKGVELARPITEAGFARMTVIKMPSGSR